MVTYVEHALVVLPCEDAFTDSLLEYLSHWERARDSKLVLPVSGEFFPRVSIVARNQHVASAEFALDNGHSISVPITNSTGQQRESPHRYKPLALDEIRECLSPDDFRRCDHVGFDLPWFEDGVHPDMRHLRRRLTNTCAYHHSFTGDDRDFILPATPDESNNVVELDYRIERRTKFEIVSIDKTSTPIIQIDFAVDLTFEKLLELFPEAIADAALRNV